MPGDCPGGGWAVLELTGTLFQNGCSQSRSQSFVPLDQRSENESSGSNHFEITKANNRILVIRLTAQSQSAYKACYGACLKWMLPELSFSDRWSRGTKLWERDWFTAQSQTASMACYGACLKWLLPELSFSDRWSRGTKLWERD